MIVVSEEDHRILQKIFSKYPYDFYAYGSRTRSDFRTFSDLDICYKEEIPSNLIFNLKEELEESDLSIFIELVSWKKMRPQLQKAIEKDLILVSF